MLEEKTVAEAECDKVLCLWFFCLMKKRMENR